MATTSFPLSNQRNGGFRSEGNRLKPRCRSKAYYIFFAAQGFLDAHGLAAAQGLLFFLAAHGFFLAEARGFFFFGEHGEQAATTGPASPSARAPAIAAVRGLRIILSPPW
ncbi:MAG: hypothetical protein A3I00_04355 [Betaproteobacteria bacterium RIFCSPLOWO2_02_FULL_64_12]|nr:MAG: hypothetical protein A3I00_04355 [Betaproteobacteria bacterium RIFCSPLOWO2_02_FULL_64_12]